MSLIKALRDQYPEYERYSDEEITSFLSGVGMEAPTIQTEQAGEDEGRTWGEFASDTGSSIMGGFANLGGDLAEIVDTGANLVGVDVDLGISEAANRASDYWQDQKSDSLKLAYDQLGAADGFIETLASVADRPELIPDIIAGSIPYLLPTGAAARIMRGGKSAATAVAGIGGLLEGANASRESKKTVDDLTPEQLAEGSEQYRTMLESGMTPERAKEEIRKKTGLTAFAFTAPIAMLAGKLTGAAKLETDFFTGKGVGSGVGRFSSVLAKEGGEEIIQEGSNALGSNLGVQTHADSTQDLGDGLGQAAALGLVAGAGQAAPIAITQGLIPPLKQAESEIQKAGEQAAEAGGDSLDQAVAKGQAQQETVPSAVAESAKLKMPEQSDYSGLDVPTANRNANAGPQQPRGKWQGIDRDILTANREGFHEEQIRLTNAKRLYERAERKRQAGDIEGANKDIHRANQIHESVIGANETIKSESTYLPALYVSEGEVQGGELATTPDQPNWTQPEIPIQGRAEEVIPELELSGAKLPPGTGQINMGREYMPPQAQPIDPLYDGVGENVVQRQAPSQPTLPNQRTITPQQFAEYDQKFRASVSTPLPRRTPEQVEAKQVVEAVDRGEVSVQEQPAQQQQAKVKTVTINTLTDDLKAAIAKNGGINRSEAEAQGVDPANFGARAKSFGNNQIFTNNGKSFDEMAEALEQDGFVQGADRNWQLAEKLDKALAGEAVYTPEGYAYQQQLRAEEEAKLQEVADSEVQGYIEVASQEAALAGIPQDVIEQHLRDNKNNEVGFAVEIRNEIERVQAEGLQRREGNPESTEVYEGEGFDLGQTTTAEQVFGAEEELLASYTEQDLQDKEAREQDKDAAAESEDQAFQKNSADNFTLGASEGTAGEQVNPAVSGGSGDMFAQPTPTQKQENPAAKIEDFGEKIGGARKDTANRGFTRKAKGEKDTRPGWMKRYVAVEVVAGRPENMGKWQVFDERKGRAANRKFFDSEQEAMENIPLIEVSRNHTIRTQGGDTYAIVRRVTDRKMPVVKGGFNSREEAMEYMVRNPVEIIEHKTRFEPTIRPEIEGVVRTGDDHLDGKPSTPEMFGESFGFRGVEFGNWNNQAERQMIMDHAYNALMDLSQVLEVDPRALSLNGELALAFGARGHGLQGAAAHYERDHAVINLTKLNGAGALAHEWMHAVDHYFGRQDGKASSEKEPGRNGGKVYKARTPDKDYFSHGHSYQSKARPEVIEAWKDVLQTIFKKSQEYIEDNHQVHKWSKEAENSLGRRIKEIRDNISKEYPYGKRFTKPATDEQLVEFDRLIDMLWRGEGMEEKWIPNSRSSHKGRWTSDTLEELSAVYKKVRGRTGFSNRDALVRLREAYTSYKHSVDRAFDAENQVKKTRTIGTDFIYESRRIDEGQAKDYWSAEHEMMARAFEAYIDDKVRNGGEQSRFLVHGADNVFYIMHGIKPYPEGKERKAINKSFDKFFKVVETKETESGVALFSRDRANSTDNTTVLSVDAVESVASNIARRFKLRGVSINTVATESDLPADILKQATEHGAEGEIGAVLHQGSIYLVADKMPDATAVETAIWHESAHYGGRTVFGKDIGKAYRKLAMRLGGIKGIKNKAEELGVTDLMAPYFESAKDMKADAASVYLIDELLSHANQLQAGEKLPARITRALKEFYGAIRDMLRRWNFKELPDLTDSDLAFLLKQINKAAQEGEGSVDAPQFMRVSESEELSMFFADLASTIDEQPAFSRVPSDAPVIETDGDGIEFNGDLRAMSEAALDYAEDNFINDTIINRETGDSIIIGKRGVKHTLRGAQPDLIKTVVVTPEILELGTYLGKESDKNNDPNVIAEHFYGIKVAVDGSTHDVVSVVKEYTDGSRYYDHSIETKEGDTQTEDSNASRVPPSEMDNTTPNDSIEDDPAFSRLANPEEQSNNTVRSTVRDVIDSWRFQMQDKFIDLKRKQQEVGEVDDEANAYQKAAIWEGKAGEQLNDFDEQRVQPLLEQVAQTGLDLDQVGEWLVARHAEEANEYLAEINPDKSEDERYRLSGMSNDEASAILDKYQENAELQELGEAIDQINRDRVSMLVDRGLISQSDADAWQGRYEHYVPLKREEADEGFLPSRGQGFSMKGKESKQRTGSAYWTPGKILSNVIANYEQSIIRSEKNEVGKALLKFVEQNPDDNFWTVVTERKRSEVRNGKVIEVTDNREGPADFSVKVDGVQYMIEFNTSNEKSKRLVEGLKNLQVSEMGSVMRGLASVTRFLATINTSWNPEFMVSNFFRDAQTAAYNLSDTELKDMEGRVLKDIFPAMNGIRNALFGDGSSEWAGVWEDFRKSGGKTGWLDLHSDIQAKEKDLKKMVKRLQDGKPSKMAIMRFVKGVEDMNNVIENAVRLSAYKHSLEAGLSKDKAAALAKDLTVNFNRKGNKGPMINAMYMFFNAAIQGNVRLLQAMVNSKKGRVLALSTVGFAVMLDMINRSLSGEDDDGENIYDTLPDHIKDRNIIIMGEKEPIVKIPAPWGYNVLHVLGQEIGSSISNDRFDALESGSRAVMSVADAFNPVGSGTFLQMVSPTVIDPMVQIGENKNFFGSPLKPEHTFDAFRPRPEYQMHFSGATEHSKAITKWLNDISGGNQIRPGAVNWSPEVLDMWVDTFTGGLGRTAIGSYDAIVKSIKGEKLSTSEIPFVRKLTGAKTDYGVKGRYYEWSRDVGYAKQELKQLKGKELLEARRSPQVKLIAAHKATEKRLRALRKIRKNLERHNASKERIEKVDQKIREAMAKFNKRYAETVY